MTPEGEHYRSIILLTLRLRCSLGKICEQYDLTPVQGMVLAMLEPGERLSMNRISCRLGCDASNTTGLIDRLEAQKLIERSKDPADKRVTMIGLTTAGETQRAQVLKDLADHDALHLATLTPEQQKALIALSYATH